MIAILDYGSGNIRSAQRACERAGLDVVVTSDLEIARESDGLVVPGVGAFTSCVRQLCAIGGDDLIRERVAAGRAVLGICVGMQILFEGSAETSNGESATGLGLIAGEVARLSAPILPQIGWNTVTVEANSQLFAGVEDERFYFVHSFAALPDRSRGAVETTSDYGGEFLAAIEVGPISAVQFHPEKSGAAGISLLRNWGATLRADSRAR